VDGMGPAMTHVPDAPAAVLAAAKDLLRRGLVEGTAGNISARQEDGSVVVTPSSVDYEAMGLDDLVVVDPAGALLDAPAGRSPTSELSLHLACYRAFDDVASVIHAHPVWATMFAVARRDLPACIDEFTMYVGGDVRCAAYGPSGSEELAANAVAALHGRGAALLANHGLVAVGPSPTRVLHIVALVERSAQIVWGASALGAAVPLPRSVEADLAGVYQIMRALP
jgi:L-fuculose-phosphate aldolase